MTETHNKTENEQAPTVRSAVNRASSKTPLDDSGHIDPQQVRQSLIQKREAENGGPSQTVEPVKLHETVEKIPQSSKNPPEHLARPDDSPENIAKDKVRADMPKTIKTVKEQFRG